MFYAVVALLALAATCAVSLGLAGAGELESDGSSDGPAPGGDLAGWRAAALEAHQHANHLRRGIASALDAADGARREAILRDTLARARRPERVRVEL